MGEEGRKRQKGSNGDGEEREGESIHKGSLDSPYFMTTS